MSHVSNGAGRTHGCACVWPGSCLVHARMCCESGSTEWQRRAPASLATSQVASASKLPPEDGMAEDDFEEDGRSVQENAGHRRQQITRPLRFLFVLPKHQIRQLTLGLRTKSCASPLGKTEKKGLR